MRRRHLGIVLGALLLATAGCTTTTVKKAEDKPSAKASATTPACPGGTFRWAGVTREKRLTEISPVVTVKDGDRGWITFRTQLVRDIVPRVDTSDGSVSAHRVLAALAKRLKWWDAEQFAAPGEESADRRPPPLKMGTLGHGGRYVDAKAVSVVEGSFTVACPGRTVYGSVTTWLNGNTDSSLECGVDPHTDEAWVKEAYRLACGGKAT
ncbi:hypothetical protein ACGFZS_00370 [Streptomyces sp. NPDC048288]|uniref:hypothetical protein n=1 Tax=Streptomyces sp. NPDC048288 TaxID=3365529 RepID=UPI003717791D